MNAPCPQAPFLSQNSNVSQGTTVPVTACQPKGSLPLSEAQIPQSKDNNCSIYLPDLLPI